MKYRNTNRTYKLSSMQASLYHLLDQKRIRIHYNDQNKEFISIWQAITLAKKADRLRTIQVIAQSAMIANLLGYEVLERHTMSDYRWRKLKHFKVGLRAYALRKLEPATD